MALFQGLWLFYGYAAITVQRSNDRIALNYYLTQQTIIVQVTHSPQNTAIIQYAQETAVLYVKSTKVNALAL